MKCSIGFRSAISVAIAICIPSPSIEVFGLTALLTSTGLAQAQDSQVSVPSHKGRVARLPRHSKKAARAPNDTGDVSDETTSTPRLPDYFRNCEHPAPRLCNNN